VPNLVNDFVKKWRMKMGGLGSGRGYRWDGRTKTCGMLALDIRRMKGLDCLHVGYVGNYNWYSRGERIARIRFSVGETSIHLNYSHNDEPMKYAVSLDRTPCNYGGRRTWFLCPASSCGRRVVVLYGGKVFACRKCHDLRYQSQSEPDWDRALRKADKIRDALGWEAGVANGWGPKPKGMHWITFERFVKEHDYQSNFANQSILKGLGILD
jgi:hypothetical protein